MTIVPVPLVPVTQAPANDGHGQPAPAAAQRSGAASPERRSLSQGGHNNGSSVSVPNNALQERSDRGASSGITDGRRLAGVVWKRGQINTAFRRSSSPPCPVCAHCPVGAATACMVCGRPRSHAFELCSLTQACVRACARCSVTDTRGRARVCGLGPRWRHHCTHTPHTYATLRVCGTRAARIHHAHALHMCECGRAARAQAVFCARVRRAQVLSRRKGLPSVSLFALFRV